MARRSNNEGSIYWWEGKGLWAAAITLPNGKRKVKTSKLQKTVKDWLVKERGKIQDGNYLSDDRITVGAFLTRYLEDYGKRSLRVTTLQGYQAVIQKHIIPELGSIRLVALRADQINHLLAKELEAGKSPRFVEYVHGILKRSLNLAVRWGLLTKNPALLVSPPKVKFKIPNTWSADQLQKFLEHIKADRWAGIYYLACVGMRKGEILGLPLKALDLDEGKLMVIQTIQFVPGQGILTLEPKTDKSRRLIRLPEFVRKALKDHLLRREILAQNANWKESGLVFTTDIGTPISPRNMLRHFKTKLTEAGLPNIRFHDLRHSVASILLEKNTHPKLVSELLGHSSINLTLSTYSHIINPMNTVVADTLDGAIKV